MVNAPGSVNFDILKNFGNTMNLSRAGITGLNIEQVKDEFQNYNVKHCSALFVS